MMKDAEIWSHSSSNKIRVKDLVATSRFARKKYLFDHVSNLNGAASGAKQYFVYSQMETLIKAIQILGLTRLQ